MSNLSWDLRSTASGNLVLHGLVASPREPVGLIVHIHGTWGNFYGNAFVQEIGDAVVSDGWAFATVNVPGHDETAMDENLADSIAAITSWLNVLNPCGLPVILQGHSLGALKIIELASEPGRVSAMNIVGIILLSAFDCVGFYLRESSFNEIDLATVRGEEIVPEAVFSHWLLRWSTLKQLAEVDGEWDIFRSRLQNPNQLLDSVQFKVPVFFAIGEQDFAAVPSVDSVVATVRRTGFASDIAIIPGAPHGYGGQEHLLVARVIGWLRLIKDTI
jgi:pimeloyl-ACP methyl ester carboxylesterase